MAREMHLLLVLVFAAVHKNVVYGCFRSPVQDDVDRLKRDVINLQKQFESQHEILKHSQRAAKVENGQSAGFVHLNDDLIKLKRSVYELQEKQSHFEELTESTEAQRNELKNVIDRLGKDLDNKVETTMKLIKEVQEKADKQQSEFRTLLKKTDNLDGTVNNRLEEFTKSLQSLQELDDASQENYKAVQQSLNDLSAVVNSDLKTKVQEFDKHIDSIQEAKHEADKLLSDLQEVVDKIRPNTFNKGAAVSAFLIVVIFVFFLAFWVYRLQQTIEQINKRQ